MTTSMCLVRSLSSASLPLLATATSWPARRRQIERNSRIDCSSSTTKICPTPSLWHDIAGEMNDPEQCEREDDKAENQPADRPTRHFHGWFEDDVRGAGR